MNNVIDFTKRANEKELKKIPNSKTKAELIQELIDFIGIQNEQTDNFDNADEDFFEFLLLVKTELQHLKEKNVVEDYFIRSHKNNSITVNIKPVVQIDKIDMKVIISSGEYD